MAVDILSKRMKNGVGSKLKRRLVIRREECIIDEHKWARRVLADDAGDMSDVNESKSRVCGRFYPNKLKTQLLSQRV